MCKFWCMGSALVFVKWEPKRRGGAYQGAYARVPCTLRETPAGKPWRFLRALYQVDLWPARPKSLTGTRRETTSRPGRTARIEFTTPPGAEPAEPPTRPGLLLRHSAPLRRSAADAVTPRHVSRSSLVTVTRGDGGRGRGGVRGPRGRGDRGGAARAG